VGKTFAVKDADTLRLDGKTYRLDGIDAPELDQSCLDEKGATWECGIAARDQLNEFINKRAVQCDDRGPDTPFRERRIGICRIEGERATLNPRSWPSINHSSAVRLSFCSHPIGLCVRTTYL
jgi:endonuclease YncB( thermonuclease family)